MLHNYCLQFLLGHEDDKKMTKRRRYLPHPHPLHEVSYRISYFLTSFYYKVLYVSSILAGGHTGVVTFLV